MRLADFFIGKPGPGSLSEAVQCGLPVIVTRNALTMPQERWNTEWVSAQGLGIVERSFARVDRAVASLKTGLPGFRARAAAMPNRAVFEVPNVLQRILEAEYGAEPGAARAAGDNGPTGHAAVVAPLT